MTKKRKSRNGTTAVRKSSTDGPITVVATQEVPRTIKAAVGPNARIWYLPEFLRQHVPSVSSILDDNQQLHDDVDVRRLFNHTLVSLPECSSFTTTSNRTCRTQRESLSSLVDGVVWSLVQRRSRPLFQKPTTSECRNVLAQGYVAASEGLQQRHAVRPCPNMQSGVLCIHLNDNASYCQTSKYFQFLHALLGDGCLRMLLLQTTLFIPVYPKDQQQPWRGNYLQLCGPPLSITKDSVLPPKNHPSVSIQPTTHMRKKRKRRRSQERADPVESPHHHLGAQAIVPRSSLFYSDSFVPKVGLPSRHILNTATNPQQLLACMLEELVRSTATTKTTLTAAVAATPTRRSPPDIMTRIKSKRWWPRLQSSGVPVCQNMLVRHCTCDYARLLERHCAMPPVCHSKRMYPAATAGDVLPPHHEPPQHQSHPTLDQVAMAHTPADQVISFLTSVLRRIFPSSFWGSEHNFQSMLHVVDVLVHLRRQERMCNQTLLTGFRTTDISWLIEEGTSITPSQDRRKRKLSQSQHVALTQRVLCLLRWVVGRFVIPLLRCTFYVTEAEFSARKVLYYRKPVWCLFRSLSMEKLLQKQYNELKWSDAAQRQLRQQLSFSRLRLLPKATGVRPLAMLNVPFTAAFCALTNQETNDADDISFGEPAKKKVRRRVSQDKEGGMSKRKRLDEGENHDQAPVSKKHKSVNHNTRNKSLLRVASGGHDRSTNEVLKETFDVVQYEVARNPASVGSGVFGLSELYPRYSKFMKDVNEWRLQQRNGRMHSSLYFASVDINKCYDNIDQDHLLSLIRQHVSDQDYLIQHYSLVFPFESTGRVFKRFKKNVGPPETFLQFHRTASEMTSSHTNCIFVDGTRCLLAKREATIRLLEEHLQSHVVVAKGRYGNRYLLQGTGIPQGSVLSSLLCNLYYGDVEKEILGEEFSAERRSPAMPPFLLVRMVDDFLLITTERRLATLFVKRMYAGSPKRGALINKEKTIVSFDCELCEPDGTNVVLSNGLVQGANGGRHFPWCGLLFDSETGEVRVDYSRFAGGKASGALTVDRIGEPGGRLALYLKTFVRPRCQSILFDPSINGARVIAINFYQVFLLCAVKAVEYMECSEMNPSSNQQFILRSIDEAISYARGLISCRLQLHAASSTPMNAEYSESRLDQKRALCLGWHAFCVVFRRASAGFYHLSCQLAAMCRLIEKDADLRKASSAALLEITISGLL